LKGGNGKENPTHQADGDLEKGKREKNGMESM